MRPTPYPLHRLQSSVPLHVNQKHNQKSRERDEFGISRHAVGTDVVLGEALLGVDAAGLVEADAAGAHEALDVALALGVEAGARVAVHDVGREVEVGRREARLDVAHEGRGRGRGGEPRVDVVLEGEVGEPVGAG